MIDVKESISLMLENKKLNVLLLEEIAESNNLENLIDLCVSIKRIGYQSVQVPKPNSLIKQQLQKPQKSEVKIKDQSNNSTESQDQTINPNPKQLQHPKQSILKTLSEDDTIEFLTILKTLYLKLRNTQHQLLIRSTIDSVLLKFKQYPNYARIQKIKQLVSLLSSYQVATQRQQTIRMLIKSNTLFETIQIILDSFQNIFNVYEYLEKGLLPILAQNLITIKKKDRIPYLMSCCKVLQLFIPPLELEIQIQKNALSQSRRFIPSLVIKILKSKGTLLKGFAKLLNEMILCPSEIELQLELFILLRRLYYLWGEHVKNPIFVVICNILIYSQQQTDLKSICFFCYRIIQEKKDLHLSIMLQNSEYFKILKQSPYFSSKALAYLNESNCNLSTSNMKLPFWKLLSVVGAGQIKQYLVIIEKQGSLLCWEIILKGYDIRFGIYKVDDLRSRQVQDYQTEKECKAVVKLNKLNVNKEGYNGSILMKTGIYKIVFDNTYSYLRSKEVIYNFSILEPSEYH